MGDVTFTIGHKDYTVQAQDGEERLLRRAAVMMGEEAKKILAQAGRVPEPRLLLLAGLMLADRVAALEDRAKQAEGDAAKARSTPPPGESVSPQMLDALAELAARAESLAQKAEDLAAD